MVPLFACILFLVLVLFPFLSIPYHSIVPEDDFKMTYWSYKTVIIYYRLGFSVGNETHCFIDYWFLAQREYDPPTPVTVGVSWVLVSIFLIQTFTIGFGVLNLFLHRKLVRLLPLISCLFVVFLMTYVGLRAQHITHEPPEFELGYWLCYPSAILFLFAFLLNARSGLKT